MTALSVGLAGCSAIQFDEAPRYDLTGEWVGEVELEGQGALDATLRLDQDGHALRAVVSMPVIGVRATGRGVVDNAGDVQLDLTYDVGCPGTAQLEGRVGRGRSQLTGTLTASDCTGTPRGTFAFSR